MKYVFAQLLGYRFAALRDGRRLLVRPITPADKALLSWGVAQLSRESSYLRFFSSRSTLSAAELRYLTELDHVDHHALVAVLADDPDVLVGVVRFVRQADDSAAAEVAMTIGDDYQESGRRSSSARTRHGRGARPRHPAVRRDHARREPRRPAPVRIRRPRGRGPARRFRDPPGVRRRRSAAATRGPRFPSCSPRRRSPASQLRAVQARPFGGPGCLRTMDAHLKLLAEAGLAAGAAEEAIEESAFGAARDLLDVAEAHLATLRTLWPEMSASERSIVGKAAKPVADRVGATARRIPKRAALSEGAPELDPDEDLEPGASPVVTDLAPTASRRPHERHGSRARHRSGGEISVRHAHRRDSICSSVSSAPVRRRHDGRACRCWVASTSR